MTSWDTEECDGVWPPNRRSPYARFVGGFAWLLFILLPLGDTLSRHHVTLLGRSAAVAAAVVFVGLYVSTVWSWRRNPFVKRWPTGSILVRLAVLYALSGTLTLAAGSGWAFLFTYTVAVTAMSIPAPRGIPIVLGTGVLCAVLSAVAGANGGTIIGYFASTAGVGMLMVVMRDLRARNAELTRARAELARMAVAEERQRFARDLHDLLGHSLSVIALKAELAGRLLPGAVDDAAREVAEVERVARCALSEVRDAVSGYRELTLSGELAGARMALSAAGIEADVQVAPVELPPDTEAMLAWAVREGATNVIRHSHATKCTFRIAATAESAELEVLDDGVGGPADGLGGPAGSVGGHGLRGLSERAHALRGAVEAGARPLGGYRLAVRLPAIGGPAAASRA
jgi:two-component system, NarL family, sensor histidine kinase DesK